MRTNAVVLAGGKNSPEMTEVTETENRALTPLGGRTMLEYVVSALNRAPSVGEIVVVGAVPQSELYRTVTPNDTLLGNLLAGLDAAGDGERVLISTSDIPFLTPDAVEDFLTRALATGADLCCSYVPLALCDAKYPEMKRTAVKLSEGKFTLGNLMLVSPKFLRASEGVITAAYAARKSPVAIARLLGGGLLLRLLAAHQSAGSHGQPRFGWAGCRNLFCLRRDRHGHRQARRCRAGPAASRGQLIPKVKLRQFFHRR